MPCFVELCLKRVRRLFGPAPIVLSDDLSPESPVIEAIADREGCRYTVGKLRRSHFSGDIQASVNALLLAEETHSDIALKISQRLIPVLPVFVEVIHREFSNPQTNIVLPGQIPMRQVARPKARFYTRFGILTDVVAMRRGSISPEKLVQTYRARAHAKDKAEALVETTFGWLLANHFKSGARIVQEWTSHRPMEPKVFLRKSQSTAQEYAKIAAMEGMTQNGWDLREWADIETINYIPRPNQV